MVVIFTLVMLHLYVLDLMCNVIKYDCFVKQYEQMILIRLFGYRFFCIFIHCFTKKCRISSFVYISVKIILKPIFYSQYCDYAL